MKKGGGDFGLNIATMGMYSAVKSDVNLVKSAIKGDARAVGENLGTRAGEATMAVATSAVVTGASIGASKAVQAMRPGVAEAGAAIVGQEGVLVSIQGKDMPAYRAGDFTLKPSEFIVTPNGKYPARGLSLNADPAKLEHFEGGANELMSIPDELEIIHTPTTKNPYHLDVIPKDLTITEADFQNLLYQIKAKGAN